MDYFGWRYALVANCSLTIFIFLCGCFMCPLNSFSQQDLSFSQVEQNNFEENLNFIENDQTDHVICCIEKLKIDSTLLNSFKIFNNISFLLFCLNNFIFFGCLTILWIYINGYIINEGLGNQSDARLIYSAIGISNLIGRLFLGILCDHKRVCPVVLFTTFNFILALNQFYFNFARTFTGAMLPYSLENNVALYDFHPKKFALYKRF